MQADKDLVYQIALTMVPNIGHAHAKKLLHYFGSAEKVFAAPESRLEKIYGIGSQKAAALRSFRNFKAAETEIRFIEKYRIQPLFLNSPLYPQRLNHCADPPVMLYYRGNADLNAEKMIAVVGTRSATEYGRMLTEKLVKALQPYGVTIVSGLAFGIDSCAHKAALNMNLPTIGVLAHGLDTMYPPENSAVAKKMMTAGGLLSEYTSGTKLGKYNFPGRNRIVAGITDATIVIETGEKGGSLITADLAHGYHRAVYAFPGRTTDTKSAGCNLLIRKHVAAILNNPNEFIEEMGWADHATIQQNTIGESAGLFDELDPKEKTIVELLKNSGTMHIDQIFNHCDFDNGTLAALVLGLELRNIVRTLPGKRVSLI